VVSEAEPPVQTEEDLASRRDAGRKCAIAEEGSSSARPGAVEWGMLSGGCASLKHRLISAATPALMGSFSAPRANNSLRLHFHQVRRSAGTGSANC
jgi:hypothetical protein